MLGWMQGSIITRSCNEKMLNLTLNHSLGFYRFCFSKKTNKQTNKKQVIWDFPGGPAIKNMPANAEEVGLIQEDPTG